MPMPVVCYCTNSDFPGINLPPLLRDARTDHPGRFNDASYSECKLLDVTTVLVPWEDWFDDDGGGETKKAGRHCRRRDVPCRRTEAGGGGAPTAIVIVIVIVPSVGTPLLTATRALRRHLRTRPTGTALRRLDPPVCMSIDVKGSAVVEAGWMSTSINMVIKEMS